MADDLTTPSGIETVLADTADYDVERSVANAKRRVAALRRKLDFAASSSQDNQSIQYAQAIIQEQLNQALAFVRAHESLTDAERLANPSVTHGDFSTFGQYGSS